VVFVAIALVRIMHMPGLIPVMLMSVALVIVMFMLISMVFVVIALVRIVLMLGLIPVMLMSVALVWIVRVHKRSVLSFAPKPKIGSTRRVYRGGTRLLATVHHPIRAQNLGMVGPRRQGVRTQSPVGIIPLLR